MMGGGGGGDPPHVTSPIHVNRPLECYLWLAKTAGIHGHYILFRFLEYLLFFTGMACGGMSNFKLYLLRHTTSRGKS